jgi:EAL domain-containing protein (putative c-di-GMP-specific phosphodiesterase class I)
VGYQPVVDLRTGRPVGAQASARIDDLGTDPRPLAGLLGAGEETALLVRIDDPVLTEVIRHLTGGESDRPAGGLDQVAVTVMARHLAGSGFAADLLSRVDRAGLRHDRLQIQMAERVLMEATHSAMAGLRTLRQAGIRIGLDNFGSGYSSLAHPRQFPLDFVKIDPLFVADLERGGDERALVGAIVALAHALGLSVVVDGIENEAQLRILESLDCDRGQGPLFAGPWAPRATTGALAYPMLAYPTLVSRMPAHGTVSYGRLSHPGQTPTETAPGRDRRGRSGGARDGPTGAARTAPAPAARAGA